MMRRPYRRRQHLVQQPAGSPDKGFLTSRSRRGRSLGQQYDAGPGVRIRCVKIPGCGPHALSFACSARRSGARCAIHLAWLLPAAARCGFRDSPFRARERTQAQAPSLRPFAPSVTLRTLRGALVVGCPD